MNITVVYGSERKGSTYNITQLFIKSIKSETDNLTEFFLPESMNKFCLGCCNCFSKGESMCPHYNQVEPIRYAIESSDFVIFTTPVYALRVSGQMKTLLDHLSFQFMIHRPNLTMFSKTSLIISTGAGGGMNTAIKDISTSFRFWGMARTYKFGKAVYAADWEGVSEKNKRKISKKIEALSIKIRKNIGCEKPSFITKLLFNMFRIYHIKMGNCPYDVNYWREHGWLQKNRPWK